jgi:hypothetical protein
LGLEVPTARTEAFLCVTAICTRAGGCGWKRARRLLSDTRLPVKRIGQRCGFGSEETLRRSFIRLLSATQDYRARFSL